MEKQYNHKQAQETAQQLWKTQKIYSRSVDAKPLYSIDTPPPTVSGSLHIGHIFSYTQTDIIARYKRMSGFCVYYPFGFDDNGLPTERYVEKKLGISAHQVGRSEFIKLCLKETHEAEEQFKSLWQQMGLSVDWQYCYSTISESTRKISQESFLRLLKDGYVYRKNEPALYCTTCRTSVAQAELDDAQKPSFFNTIIFKDHNGNDLLIGTTRPELLPSCVALLYNPADTHYQHLKDTSATVPLFGHQVPIYPDEKAEIEKGTGLVMVCTFGDKTDIEWFKKFKLPYRQSIGFDGKFLSSIPSIGGLKVDQARVKILQELKDAQLLVDQKEIMHAVNIHERCKKEIEYLMLPQWFLNLLDHKQSFIAMADKITWYPAYMKSRYINWVENLGWDWGLSRQRFFGIPFPVWHCTNCEYIITPSYDQLPLDPQETPFNGACPKCKSENIVPDTDVMDTWNTSSLTPYICAQLLDAQESPFQSNQLIPMSMRPQAHDIIRTWAFYTIVKIWMHQKDIPWEEIVISGHVLSDAKEKLSKSKENASLSPERLLQDYPADVIRYWTASGELGSDIAFSQTQLKIGQRLITKLWNAFRFISEHTITVDLSKKPTNFGGVNEWLLHQATLTFDRYTKALNENEFSKALSTVEEFFWNNFCDNYLELIKDQLFHPEQYNQDQIDATRWTLYAIGFKLLQLYAPYLPYITESLYQELYKEKIKYPSLHITEFEFNKYSFSFEKSNTTLLAIIDLISQVRKLKTERQLSLKTPLSLLAINGLPELISALEIHEQLIKGITHAVVIEYGKNKSQETALQEVDGTWHMVVKL